MECIFCKIVNSEIPAELVYQDDEIVAFRDIHPKAPTHILIIPKRHIDRISDISKEDSGLIGKMVFIAKELAQSEGVAESGFRLVFNNNKDAGQEVFHIHLHLLGGRKFSCPLG
ncbi:MAG: histidine triad nucleotide-binding protein [Candidatus Kaelpia aquatica]|nr:histidine triad nucleotide-binding protein [Candidatus Kaelpia aquatica]